MRTNLSPGPGVDAMQPDLPNSAPPPLTPSLPSPPSPPLPPLSPADRPLLTRLFALKENYFALAAELATDQWNHLGESRPKELLDLMAWADRPDIAAWIERFRALSDLQRRTLALDTLEKVIKDSPAPLERRRAATTLLRALDHQWPNRKPDRQGGRPSRPMTGGRAPNPSPSHSPPPTIAPDLTHSPQTLATALAIDLRDEFPDQPIATIAAIASPYAPIADPEVLEERLDTLPPLSDQAHVSEPQPFNPEPPLAEGQELTISDPQHSGLKLTLRFVRFHTKPWRLFDLNTGSPAPPPVPSPAALSG